MKNLFPKITAILSLILVLLPVIAFAAISIPNPLRYDTFGEFIEHLINGLWVIGLALAPLMIIIGGFYFTTAAAGGNLQQVETGKKIVIYTLVGLIIMGMARGLVWYFTEVVK